MFVYIIVFTFSCFVIVQIFATPWTVAHQVPLSMGFSRQEYWNGLPFPPPGDLPDSGIELTSPVSFAERTQKMSFPPYVFIFDLSLYICILIFSYYKDTSHIN